jgi:4-amino-4-deoxy-L-arabinose transferase-like glycosyltransferase
LERVGSERIYGYRLWHILAVSAEAQASTTAARGPSQRARRLELVSGSRLALVLFAAGLAISAFTILRRVDPFDEGIALQAARRVMQGQVPHRDFLWAYGPADPYLMAGLFKLFGVSLLDWRILRVLSDAASAVAVFVLARRLGGVRLALVAWLAAACAFAQPTSANPQAEAFAFVLWALVAVTGDEEPGTGLLAGAGVLTALAAAWRPDFGAYAVLACGAALLLRPGARPRRLAIWGGCTLAGVLVVYVPLLVAVGPHDLYEGLIGTSAREGSYWRLPFPVHYRGPLPLWPPGQFVKRLKDVLVYYVPLLLVIGLAIGIAVGAWRWAREQRLPWQTAAVAVLGVVTLAYLLSRTDDLHTAPLLAVVVALLAGATAWLAAGGRRSLAAVPLVVLLLLTAYGLSNRLSALFLPPKLATIHVAIADGVKDTPANAAALGRVVPLVDRLVPPGGYIYVAPRRSDLVRLNDPALYALTERNNPLRQDFGLQTSPMAQQRIVDVLRRTQPKAIVRWTDPISSQPEPNKRGRSSGSRILDQYIDASYRVLERDGFYTVMVPRQR